MPNSNLVVKQMLLAGFILCVNGCKARPNSSDSKEKSISFFGLFQSSDRYIESCKTAEVPIPPPFGDGRWADKGVIPSNRLILNPEFDTTKLFVYEPSPDVGNGNGMCAAIARGDDIDTDFYATICTSLSTGATCFWDNVNWLGRVNVRGFDITKGQGADKLSENCSKCHRGPTPWIRVAGTPTANAGLKSHPNWRPLALNRGDWLNPPGPKVGGCSAGGCHAMPAPSRPYCSIIRAMMRSDRNIMPPEHILGAPRQTMIDSATVYCQGN